MVVNYNVSPSYQVREKHLFYGSLHALGIGAASFASVSGKRYSGKPDGDSRNAHLFKV